MREEFTNEKGQTLTFTDEYLQYSSATEMKSIHYDKITKIKCGFGALLYVSSNDTSFQMALSGNDKKRVKELVDYAQRNPQYFYSNPNFEEKIVNSIKNTVIFTDKGIDYYYAPPEQAIITYENIESIDALMGIFSIKKIDNTELVFCYQKEDSERAKKISNEIKKLIMAKERRIRCNVCGHIFCYTKSDIAKNNHNKTLANLHSFSAAVNAIGGTAYNMHEEQKHADAANAKIIDFSKCPKCNSSDITALTDEEWQNINNKSESTTNTMSAADEIKKFKDLLDSGIITQEEFDEKKKQLLGL